MSNNERRRKGRIWLYVALLLLALALGTGILMSVQLLAV